MNDDPTAAAGRPEPTKGQAVDHEFDKDYWDRHYDRAEAGSAGGHQLPPNPYLVHEVGDLTPGTALEAGCGEGAEAIWLGLAGWQVTAVDIAAEPLARAADRAAEAGVGEGVRWVQADLSSWDPARTYDLVTTHYAHPAMPQLEFYDRLSSWVAPGGSLLVVGHLHTGHGGHGAPDDQHPPAEASVTATSITERLDPGTWDVVTAGEHPRTLEGTGGGHGILQDVVVRAVRRGAGLA
ncbi:MAG TPA: class I SAM-dependent methyltransferase [Ornithinibacter sp.]|nr:class I SAM-dependent methyltransferase [Ornithinibacter sp.]